MKLGKSLKIFWVALILMFNLGTAHVLGTSCSASSSCGDTCYAHAPPGGSVHCSGGGMMIQCCSFFADGSVNYCVSTTCPIECI